MQSKPQHDNINPNRDFGIGLFLANQSDTIITIPQEVLEHIFTFLPPTVLGRVAQVCRYWRETNERRLQKSCIHKIGLFSPSRGISPAVIDKRVQAITTYEQAAQTYTQLNKVSKVQLSHDTVSSARKCSASGAPMISGSLSVCLAGSALMLFLLGATWHESTATKIEALAPIGVLFGCIAFVLLVAGCGSVLGAFYLMRKEEKLADVEKGLLQDFKESDASAEQQVATVSSEGSLQSEQVVAALSLG